MFEPFNKINRKTFLILVGSQALVTLLLWQLTGGGLIPRPSTVMAALGRLLTTRLLLDNLLTSLLLTGQALFYSVLITLLFGYASVIPFFKPAALFLVKCRYLTLTGLIFIFTLLRSMITTLKQGGVIWRGTFYPLAELRRNAAPLF